MCIFFIIEKLASELAVLHLKFGIVGELVCECCSTLLAFPLVTNSRANAELVSAVVLYVTFLIIGELSGECCCAVCVIFHYGKTIRSVL